MIENLSRRDVLKLAGAASLPLVAPRVAWGQELPWTPLPGRNELLARATDRTGLAQPDTVPFNEGGYQFWAVVRHPVTAA